MASTSTSTSRVQKSFKYDVFLSFRGEDTRNNFVSHLYRALEQHGIQTYKDDEKIEKGETINTQLIKSIEDSRFYIIVFSKNYASSSWCLDELVKIMESRKASEQTAYPVFYDVEPTEIRKQSGAVEEAFRKHENKEAAGKWRNALNEAGNLAGWELKNTANGNESKFIQIIVDIIFKKICSGSPSVDRNLVGMETRIEAVLSSLELDADDVRMIGIWGMGGGGKTTLARAVCDRIFIQFDDIAFVEKIREVSKSSLYGLNKLQEQILRTFLSDENIHVSSVHKGTDKMKNLLRGRKVLIVLDDVDSREQLEALAGELNWFGFGSRIIITTRDKQLLLAHQVKFINDVNLLSHAEAICLLSKYAFRRDIPIEGYEELSIEVTKYADGLPLTIKVLGSLLCCQNEPEWIDTLERLKKIPLKATMEKLELSYDGLEEDYKEIFLDVACFLKGWYIEDAIIALESFGFHARNGLRVLEQRSLITISEYGKLGMHDHLEEMGKNIVPRLHPNSRLWIKEEIVDVLNNNSGTQATKCIKVDACVYNFGVFMNRLAKLKELRYLYFETGYVSEAKISNRSFDEVGLCLPNALRFLRWKGYPFSSLPKTFQVKNLVGLEMESANLVQLWKDGEKKVLLKLRLLKILDSYKLKTLDLNMAPNLETLRLVNCIHMIELGIPAEYPKLVSLELSNLKLTTLALRITPNLQTLRIKECSDMVELHIPAECPKLVTLDLNNLKLTTLHLGITPNLQTLRIKECSDMVELHIPAECPKLVNLDLFEVKLRTLRLGITPILETVSLKDCRDLVELHMPAECPNLVNLDLRNLKLRTLHLGIAPNLERLNLWDCTDIVELRMPAECPKLVDLHLGNLKLGTLHLGITRNLETLRLDKCTDMIELHIPAECSKLVNLNLFNLKLRTLHLGITSNLQRLSLRDCTDFVELHMPAECPKLVDLHLSNLKLTTLHLGITPNLEALSLLDCTDMVELHMPAGCPKLRHLDLSNFKLRTLDLGLIPNLKSMILQDCTDLEEINAPVGCLKKLVQLYISGCERFKFNKFVIELSSQCLRKLTFKGGGPDAPKDLDWLICLEELVFSSTTMINLPVSICKLKHLKSLEIISCNLLEKLPEDIGRLRCLEKLSVLYCIQIEELPEEIGCLENLKELDITGTSITRLPKSLYGLKGLEVRGRSTQILRPCAIY